MPAPNPVFLDLDETLVHTRDAGCPGNFTHLPHVDYGPYHAWLRPNAHEILGLVRSRGMPVYLCTASERAYAAGLSALFGFGIPERNILGLEHLLAGVSGIAPDALLIDDLDADHEVARLKRWVLGIDPDQYFQIRAFRGLPLLDGFETVRTINALLSGRRAGNLPLGRRSAKSRL